ncbi:MAG: hypothetical protein U1E76_14485 [Planctomycetota bacterium]
MMLFVKHMVPSRDLMVQVHERIFAMNAWKHLFRIGASALLLCTAFATPSLPQTLPSSLPMIPGQGVVYGGTVGVIAIQYPAFGFPIVESLPVVLTPVPNAATGASTTAWFFYNYPSPPLVTVTITPPPGQIVLFWVDTFSLAIPPATAGWVALPGGPTVTIPMTPACGHTLYAILL